MHFEPEIFSKGWFAAATDIRAYIREGFGEMRSCGDGYVEDRSATDQGSRHVAGSSCLARVYSTQ